jgi:hypothetical protein
MTERSFHPNLSVAYLDRADRYVVCPQVEGAAAFEIEAGMVPMAGQDAVLEAAAFERKAHVRAAIVESKDAAAVVDDKDGTMATVHNEPPFRLQPLKAPREREFRVRRVHEHASFERCVWAPMATAQFFTAAMVKMRSRAKAGKAMGLMRLQVCHAAGGRRIDRL